MGTMGFDRRGSKLRGVLLNNAGWRKTGRDKCASR